MATVCLDPGHNSSGSDTGAEGNGLKEQDLTLDIASRLKPLLQARGISVVMTREEGLVSGLSSGYTLYQSLEARCNIANAANVDLFVSIHINSGGGTGMEIEIQGTGGEAEKAANVVLPYSVSAGGWANRGVKVDNLQVLRDTNMPAILTENGFIDNPSDAEKLADPNFRRAIAIAHAKGICEYFGIAYQETEGDEEMLDNLVIYADGDVGTALNLSYKLGCPMVLKDFADKYQAVNKHWVGVPGTNGGGNFYYAGSDRIATAKAAL